MHNKQKKIAAISDLTGFRCFALLFLACIMILPLASCNKKAEPERITITLAAPQSAHIKDFDNNYYKLWLEEQTGLNIEIIWIPTENATAIVRQQLMSGENLPDAYIGFGTLGIFDNPDIQGYGEQGVIIPLNDLIEQYGTHTKALWEEMPDTDGGDRGSLFKAAL
jgi:ABC-type glycerol-3-phosphate transport system substrate-binding protein